MNKPGLILVGAGGHARSCIDVIEQQNYYQIIGLVGLYTELHSKNLHYEVIATDDQMAQYVKTIPYALITAGQIQNAQLRMYLYQKVKLYGFQMPVIIAPTAHVSRYASVGAAKVGNNCIINNLALVEHDTVVQDHCHISTGAILNGGVSVGEGSFIGSGTVVKEGVAIGKNCLIGIGLTVRQTLADFERFTG
jgi:sugar O-acyltransferase (sialic acid O-acetyltransferase NeuD family)